MKTFRFKGFIESTSLGKNDTFLWGWAHFCLNKITFIMVRKKMHCGRQAIVFAPIFMLSLHDSFFYFNTTLKPQENCMCKMVATL